MRSLKRFPFLWLLLSAYAAARSDGLQESTNATPSDSLRIQTERGVLTCTVEMMDMEWRVLGMDSTERKTHLFLNFEERSDSLKRILWTRRWEWMRTDTFFFHGSLSNPAHASPPKGWRRWMEPVLALSALSSMAYWFYFVRSR